MNKQLRCEHIGAAAFLAFSGQLRTTGAEDFHERERGGERGRGREGKRGERGGGERARERARDWDHNVSRRMSAEDNASNTTFRELVLSTESENWENWNIDVERDDQNTTSTVHQNIFLNWHFPLFMLTLRKLLSWKRYKLDKNLAITASFLPIKQKCHCWQVRL